MSIARVGGYVVSIVLLCAASARAQSPVVFQKLLGDWSVSIASGTGPDESTLQFTATGPQAQQRQVWLDRRTRTIKDVILWNNATFVVLDEGGTADHVGIVPVPSAGEPDLFLAYDPTLSPDSRVIAFRKFAPRGGEQELVLLAYDVSLGPVANRMAAWDPLGEAIEVGWAFYPDEYRMGHTYEISPESRPAYALASGLTWIDSRRLAFLAYSTGTTKAVLVNFSSGISAPIIQEFALDSSMIVNSSRLPTDVDPASIISARSLSGTVAPNGSVELVIQFEPSPLGAIKMATMTVTF